MDSYENLAVKQIEHQDRRVSKELFPSVEVHGVTKFGKVESYKQCD